MFMLINIRLTCTLEASLDYKVFPNNFPSARSSRNVGIGFSQHHFLPSETVIAISSTIDCLGQIPKHSHTFRDDGADQIYLGPLSAQVRSLPAR